MLAGGAETIPRDAGRTASLGQRRQDMMDAQLVTRETLEQLLRDAEQAHGVYEATLGHPDDNWPAWYARYIMERLAEAQGKT
jgi:hypothetical protein